MANKGGLNKDGGINFERKRNFSTEKKPYGINTDEPEKEVKEEPKLSPEELEKAERLNAKLRKAKGIQAGGFALNGGSIIAALFYVDSLLLDPATIDSLNVINDLTGADIDFENMIAIIQGYKAQIIGFAVSSQTMIMGYKDIVQKMRDRGNESFYNVLNEELEKAGI